MKQTLALVLMVFGIVGCSNHEEKLTVVCELDGFHDKSFIFDLKKNVVSVKETLNERGYEAKKELERLYKIESFVEGLERIDEGYGQTLLDVFEEIESIRHIRSVDGGFIVFGNTKDRDDLVDFESTFNRGTLKIKKVRRMNESVIPENSGLELLEVSYAECKKPVI